MVSIADVLDEIIQNYPFIEEGLSKGLINYSAFARQIRPQIEKRLYKNIKEGTIMMALKRLSGKLAELQSNKPRLNLTDLTVRSNLTEFTFANSQTLPEKEAELFNKLSNKKNAFCNLSAGIRETTFIISSEIADETKKILKDESLISNINSLSSISISLSSEVVYMPGSYYQILKMLAWENINVIEIFSTYTELTIIIQNKDVDKAFSALKSFSEIT